MKTLPFVLLAALGGFIFLPVSFGTAVSLFVAGGLAVILVSDYGRHRPRAMRRRTPEPACTPARELRLAA